MRRGFPPPQGRQPSTGAETGAKRLVHSGAVGLDGLLHYLLAPMDVHTHAMNFTIWFEVIVAAILLLYLLVTARKHYLLLKS